MIGKDCQSCFGHLHFSFPAAIWLLLAESHLMRRLFLGMLRKIAALPSPAG
jgi:hypothetical protein